MSVKISGHELAVILRIRLGATGRTDHTEYQAILKNITDNWNTQYGEAVLHASSIRSQQSIGVYRSWIEQDGFTVCLRSETIDRPGGIVIKLK